MKKREIMDTKWVRGLIALGALAAAPAAVAQNWEFGGGAGASFYPANTITNGAATATIDTQNSIAGGLWLVQNMSKHWGGEVRLDYTRGDLELTSGSARAGFNSEAYAMHYEFQWSATAPSARIRPYLSAGAGVKYYRGIGTEVEFQPLSQFALLTKTNQLEALFTVGGGVKFRVTDHFGVRLEVHDYLTPYPKDIVVPNTGSNIKGWMQSVVPMIGISYLF